MDAGTLLAGRYLIERELASGGMGVVYAAKQLPLGRAVAVKVLRRELLKHGPFLARLKREAHTAAALKHRNIVNVTDLVLEEDVAFLVMDLLDGESFGTLIARATSLNDRVVANVGRQVLSALEAAHAAGLVHRDVKPDNIFLVHDSSGGDDTVKLLDFGLVKVNEPSNDRLTATNAVLGTWQYMAPEQARGDEADSRVDIYALGACLYYALTKKRPYQAADMEAATFALSDVRVPPLEQFRKDVDPNLRMVIARALDKDPKRRFQTAREMLDALGPTTSDSSLETAPSVSSSGDEEAMDTLDDKDASGKKQDLSTNPLASISRAIDVAINGTPRRATTRGKKPRDHRDASTLDAESLKSEEEEEEQLVEGETLPVPHAVRAVRGSAATLLDPRRRPEAYEPTVDVLPTEPIELPASDLASVIESVELEAASPPSRRKWRPPQKVRVKPLDEWADSGDAFRQQKLKRARRRLVLLVVAGLIVFASGLLLGQLLFK